MILGLGQDVVEIPRFAALLRRMPRMRGRLFADEERGLPIHSLAARYAAKEAVAKALGSGEGLSWHDVVIVKGEAGRPLMRLSGEAARRAQALGVTHTHVSLSHDGGIAAAVVVLEG